MYRLKMTAIDYAKNVNREWSCELSDDLFQNILLESHWGRVGGKGTSETGFDYEEAEAYKDIRSRRKTSLKVGNLPTTVSGNQAIRG